MAWTNTVIDDAVESEGSEQTQAILAGSPSDETADSFIAALWGQGNPGQPWRIYEADGAPYTFRKLGQDLFLPNAGWYPVDTTDWPTPRQKACVFQIFSGKWLMFGGVASGVELDETWLFDPSTPGAGSTAVLGTWTQLFPAHSPSARQGASSVSGFAIDPILFGGISSGTALDDTWQWDTTSSDWVQLTPSTTPPARFNHAMWVSEVGCGAFCQFVTPAMFGGNDGAGGVLDDTWLFKDTSPSTAFNTASFVQPAVSGTVTVQFSTTSWMLVGQNFIDQAHGGNYVVLSITDGTHVVLTYNGSSTIGTGGTVPIGTNWIVGPGVYDWLDYSSTAGSPGGREQACFGFAGLGGAVLFGGLDAAGTVLEDVWTFTFGTSGNTWVSGATLTGLGRYGGMVVNADVVDQSTILAFPNTDLIVGGLTTGGVYVDGVMAFDGTDYTSRIGTPDSVAFNATGNAVVVSDSFGNPLIVGGADGSGELDQAWMLMTISGGGTTGSLSRVDGVLWFAWLNAQTAPYVYKYDEGGDVWVPVGDGGGTFGNLADLRGDFASAECGPGLSSSDNEEFVYVTFVTGNNHKVVCFQWDGFGWVVYGDLGSGTPLDSFWFDSDTSDPQVVQHPSTHAPVVTAGNTSDGAIAVINDAGTAWAELGGAPAFTGEVGNTCCSNFPSCWILLNPDLPGQYAVVAIPLGSDEDIYISFWDGFSWSTPVVALASDIDLWTNPSGEGNIGQACQHGGTVYVACIYNGSGVDPNVQVIQIPWGGTAWAPWPSAPPANSVMAQDDPYAPSIDNYSSSAIAVTDAGIVGVIVGAEDPLVYRFWWSPPVATRAPTVNCEFAIQF